MNLSLLSVFSGVGMIDYGLEAAGWRTVAQCEIDPWRREWLRRNFPHVEELYEDVTKTDWDAFARRHGRPGLLAGGFPCQPVSVAGKGQGEADPRWLWPALRDVFAKTRPHWAVVENVRGLLRRGLDGVLGDGAIPQFAYLIGKWIIDYGERMRTG